MLNGCFYGKYQQRYIPLMCVKCLNILFFYAKEKMMISFSIYNKMLVFARFIFYATTHHLFMNVITVSINANWQITLVLLFTFIQD